MAVPWLKWLVAGPSVRRPRSVHVGFVVDKVALGRFFSKFFGFPPASHRSTIAQYVSVTAP
jgi:hypothetical protein